MLFSLNFHTALLNIKVIRTLVLFCFCLSFLSMFSPLLEAGGGEGTSSSSSSSSSDSSSDSSSEDEEKDQVKPRPKAETHSESLEETIETIIDTVMEELLFTHDLYSLVHWYKIQASPVGSGGNTSIQKYFKQEKAIKEKRRTDQFDKTSVQTSYTRLKEQGEHPGYEIYKILKKELDDREREQHAGHRFILYILNRKISETYPGYCESSQKFRLKDPHRILEVPVFKYNAKDSPKKIMVYVESHINKLPGFQSVLDFYQAIKEAYTNEEGNLTSLSRTLILTSSSCPFSESDIGWIKKKRGLERADRLYSVAVKNGPHGMLFHLELLQSEGIIFNSPGNVVSALERNELIQAKALAMRMGIDMRIPSYTKRIKEYKQLLAEEKAKPQPPTLAPPPVNPAFLGGAGVPVSQLSDMRLSSEGATGVSQPPKTLPHTTDQTRNSNPAANAFELFSRRSEFSFQGMRPQNSSPVDDTPPLTESPPPSYADVMALEGKFQPPKTQP